MAPPTDKERAAHRRALALADHFRRLAETLVPAPPTAEMVDSAAMFQAALPEAVRAEMAKRVADVATSSAPSDEERGATVEAINEAWARHHSTRTFMHLQDMAVVSAVEVAAGRLMDGRPAQQEPRRGWEQVAVWSGPRAPVEVIEDALADLKERWPDIARFIDREVFGDAVVAWFNCSSRGGGEDDLKGKWSAVANLLTAVAEDNVERAYNPDTVKKNYARWCEAREARSP